MMEPVTTTLATSGVGLIMGYVFRLIKSLSDASEKRQELMLRALGAGDDSADRAAERKGSGPLRWLFSIAIVVGVVVAPIIFGAIDSIDILYPTESEKSILWGLVRWGKSVEWKALSGYPVMPALLQGFNLILSFVVGQRPAK
jgi:hypothetical protein